MITERLEQAINEQINAEFYSEYLYLSMYTYFERINLQGFKNFMNVQHKEERAHAMGLFKYLLERGGKVVLLPVAQPKSDWDSPLNVFEDVLEHEKEVTAKINALLQVAEEEKDRAAITFLDWYLKEQVEEEYVVSNVLKTLKLICNNGNCLYMLDKELALRTYTEPKID